MLPKNTSVLFVWLLLIGAVQAGVNYDYDKTVDFTAFKTYSMGKSTPAKDPLQDQRLVAAIQAQLEDKGLEKVTEGGNLVVQYHATSKEQPRVRADTMGFGPGWGGYRRWGGFGGVGTTMVDVDQITDGQLTIDLIQGSDNQLVWRAIISEYLSDNPQKVAKKMTKAIQKAFKHYPPDAD